MENLTESVLPKLPLNPIKEEEQTLGEHDWALIVALSPWIVLLGIGCLNVLWIAGKIIVCFVKDIMKKFKKINCTTEIKCKDKSEKCDNCYGQCNCVHKVMEV